MANGSDAEALTRIKAEFEGSSSSGTEVLYRRKDGSEFWAAVFISPVRDVDGDIVQYFASLVDLTKHKQDEVRSRMLIDELNHRVKNTLSTVQSIVWQTLRTTTDPRAIRRSIEFQAVCALAVARPVDPRKMGKRRAVRYRSRCPGAIRRLRRAGGSHCDHRGEHPLPAKGSFGPQHSVQ